MIPFAERHDPVAAPNAREWLRRWPRLLEPPPTPRGCFHDGCWGGRPESAQRGGTHWCKWVWT